MPSLGLHVCVCVDALFGLFDVTEVQSWMWGTVCRESRQKEQRHPVVSTDLFSFFVAYRAAAFGSLPRTFPSQHTEAYKLLVDCINIYVVR